MAIVVNVEERCQCGFTQDQIASSAFKCFPASPQAVTYRAVLHGTASTTSSQLISQIEQWISGGVTISVQNVLLNVDTNCVIVIVSNHDDECGMMDDNTVMTESSAIGGIVGGMVAVVLILIVIIVIAVVAALFLRMRKKRQVSRSQTRYIVMFMHIMSN